jgi:hypothetical protein
VSNYRHPGSRALGSQAEGRGSPGPPSTSRTPEIPARSAARLWLASRRPG